ncbi:MAG TPA: hypothetical protein VJ729_00670 [Nitrososphaeraceae archaeon]|jgi:hypothetical protein|nr:hypothetical protein [Nitrososphaeraceae archaeon]
MRQESAFAEQQTLPASSTNASKSFSILSARTPGKLKHTNPTNNDDNNNPE